MSRMAISHPGNSDVKRGQNLETETKAEAKDLRPRPISQSRG